MRRASGVLIPGLSVTLVAVVLASCAGGGGVTAPGPTSDAVATTSTATWDLVALGDSNVAGGAYGSSDPEAAFPGVYATLLGKEQGVTVVLHSYFPSQETNEIRTVAEWNQVLATDQAMRADLAKAEIVIVLIGYHNVIPALMFHECGLSWPDPLRGCLRAATRTMPADYEQLFGAIEGLVPAGTTVLVGDYGIPEVLFDEWSSKPFWLEMKRVMFDDWRDALEAAAEAHGATVVHAYAALNGPHGEPLVDWSAITSDGWHFNAEGHRFIAEIFLEQDDLGAT